MEQYIKQLIDDIRNATLRFRPPHYMWLDIEADPDNEVELEDLTYIEKNIEGDAELISDITGINYNQLPDEELLTDDQRATLGVELENLLLHYNFKLVFPESYPAYLRYYYIKEFWAEEQVVLSFGISEIEFCEMNDEVFCPFEGYCKICDENREQMKLDEEYDQINLDENSKLPDWMDGDDNPNSDFEFNVEDLLPSKKDIEAFIKNRKEVDGVDIDDEPISILYLKDEDRLRMMGRQGNEIMKYHIPMPGLCIVC